MSSRRSSSNTNNGDAVPDLYVEWPSKDQFRVLDGADGFQTPLLSIERDTVSAARIGDYNQDGTGDLYEFSAQRAKILNGANNFSTILLDVTLPSGYEWDLLERDGDGITDTLGVSTGASSNIVLSGGSAYTSSSWFPSFESSLGHAWADYNGDTISDLVEVHGTSRQDIMVLSGADNLGTVLTYSSDVLGNYGYLHGSVVVQDSQDTHYSDPAPETPYQMQMTDPDPDNESTSSSAPSSAQAAMNEIDFERYGSGAIVSVNENVMGKVTNYHRVPQWLVGRVIGYGRQAYFQTQEWYYTPYAFRVWEYECDNSGCRRTPNNVYVRFVVNWYDGTANHGDLITMYCKTRRGYTCPIWLQDAAPYLGPPGPQ